METPVHRGTREKLRACGISTAGKYAVQMKRQDYEDYDYLLGMEERNLSNMRRIAGGDPDGKMYRLLEFFTKSQRYRRSLVYRQILT